MPTTTENRRGRNQRRKPPTRDQIRARCRKIQEEWSDTTRRQRAGEEVKHWTVPETRVAPPRVSSRGVESQF